MALVLADRVQQVGTANTTVSFTLGAAVTGYQSFSTIGNNNTTFYGAVDSSGNWEVGLGTYTTSGPTLTRTTVYSSSNAGSAVTFSGSVNVFATYPASRSVNLDANSIANLTNPTVTNYTETPFTANTSTAITIALTNGTVQILTLTGSPTITMPAAVSGKSFIIMLKTGAGSFTVTWTTVKWPSGTAPTITSTASRQDVFSFFSDGTNWYGSVLGQNYTP